MTASVPSTTVVSSCNDLSNLFSYEKRNRGSTDKLWKLAMKNSYDHETRTTGKLLPPLSLRSLSASQNVFANCRSAGSKIPSMPPLSSSAVLLPRANAYLRLALPPTKAAATSTSHTRLNTTHVTTNPLHHYGSFSDFSISARCKLNPLPADPSSSVRLAPAPPCSTTVLDFHRHPVQHTPRSLAQRCGTPRGNNPHPVGLVFQSPYNRHRKVGSHIRS